MGGYYVTCAHTSVSLVYDGFSRVQGVPSTLYVLRYAYTVYYSMRVYSKQYSTVHTGRGNLQYTTVFIILGVSTVFYSCTRIMYLVPRSIQYFLHYIRRGVCIVLYILVVFVYDLISSHNSSFHT